MFICSKCKREVETQGLFCPFCGQAAPQGGSEPGDPFVGQTVADKYFIHQLLGRGGMGKVYKATHLTLDRPVVLKILDRSLLADPSIVQRFQREARAASRLNHPNSISVIDFGQANDGTLFIAMEYLSGRSLARIIAEEFPVDPVRIVKIGSQILAALTEAHPLGILHRDLKPENVMVESRRDESDFVKVLDFGIAKLNEPDGSGGPRLTQAGMVCGTPGYMSPEQARGEEVDARSDLYSVGVILYELVTGKLPFEADTPIALVTKVLVEHPTPPSVRRPDVTIPPDLEALIMRAIAPDPAERPESAEAFRGDLLACTVPESRPLRPTPQQGTMVLDPSLAISGAKKPGSGVRRVTGPQRPPSGVIRPTGPSQAPPRSTPSQSLPLGSQPSDRPSPLTAALGTPMPRPGSQAGMLAKARPATPGPAPIPTRRPSPPPRHEMDEEGEADEGTEAEVDRRAARPPPAISKSKLPVIAGSGAAALLLVALVVWGLTRGGGEKAAPPSGPNPPAAVLPPSPPTPPPVAPTPPPVPSPAPAPQPSPSRVALPTPAPPPARPEPTTETPPPSDAAPRRHGPAIRDVREALNSLKTPPASSGDGILSIVATPWANVTINGRPIGETPREVRLAEGTYRLRAIHPALGTAETKITIVAGKRKMWNATFTK